MLKINGKLVTKNFIEMAEFSVVEDAVKNTKTPTLTLTLIGIGTQVFTGDDAQAAWDELNK